MIKKYLSFTLICLLLTTANFSLVAAQTKTDSSVDKIKSKVYKRGTGEDKRVQVKMMNGAKLNGYISKVEEESFTLTDSKTNQNTVINYNDVAKINNKTSKANKIALIIVSGAAATAAVILLSFLSIRCRNEGGC